MFDNEKCTRKFQILQVIETTKILCGQLNVWYVYNLPTFQLDALVILRVKVK